MKSTPTTLIIAFLSLFLASSSIAQMSDSSIINTQPVWIEKMNDRIAIDASFNNAYETFEVIADTNIFQIVPNVETNLRFKLNYKFISVGVQFSPQFIPGNGDYETEGKTKLFGLGASATLTHWLIGVSYSKIKGYYLKNTADYTSWVEGDPYIQLPDLTYKGIALDLGYVFNQNFSMNSLTNHTQRQLKSAGSILPTFDFRYYNISSGSSTSGQESSNIESNLGAGYIYTWVLKKSFYVSLGALVGAGYQYTQLISKFPSGNLESHQNNFLFRWDAKAGLGYNGPRFYTGFYGTFSQSEYNQQHTTARNLEARYFYHAFIGVRFNSPEYVKKSMDWIEQKATKLNPF